MHRLPKNLDLVQKVNALAQAKQVTPSQLALAWVLAQGEDIVAIPGTKRRTYLEQNVGGATVKLTPDELKELAQLAPPGIAAGQRYADMSSVNR